MIPATRILRWPLVATVFLILLLELTFYTSLRWIVYATETVFTGPMRRRRLRELSKMASYEQWFSAAEEIDRALGKDKWAANDSDSAYDHVLIERSVLELKSLMKSGNLKKLMNSISSKCHKNTAGIHSEILYSHMYSGKTKQIIHEYTQTLNQAILYVLNVSEEELPKDKKIKYFKSLEKSYGKSALCLSGGGTQGYYHIGVIRALLERGLLPSVIAGTSAGALIGSIVGTRTDEELKKELTPNLHRRMTACEEPLLKRVLRFFTKGHMFEKEQWLAKTRDLVGPWTFEEAYLRTGRVFNVTITSANQHSPPLLLNYITAPHVLVYSAVVASAAIPGLLEPCELFIKTEEGTVEPYHFVGEKWTDGGLKTDLPMQSLSHLFNINNFIVSQVNPHIIPFLYERKGSAGQPVWRKSGVRGGFITALLEAVLKYDMKKWLIVMKELELFPMFLGHDWSLVFLQNFAGTVTIVPNPRFEDYILIVTDPSYERMAEYIRRGRVFAWQKVAMIETTYTVEKTIDAALRSLGAPDLFDTIFSSPIVQEIRQHQLEKPSPNVSTSSPSTSSASLPGTTTAALASPSKLPTPTFDTTNSSSSSSSKEKALYGKSPNQTTPATTPTFTAATAAADFNAIITGNGSSGNGITHSSLAPPQDLLLLANGGEGGEEGEGLINKDYTEFPLNGPEFNFHNHSSRLDSGLDTRQESELIRLRRQTIH